MLKPWSFFTQKNKDSGVVSSNLTTIQKTVEKQKNVAEQLAEKTEKSNLRLVEFRDFKKDLREFAELEKLDILTCNSFSDERRWTYHAEVAPLAAKLLAKYDGTTGPYELMQLTPNSKIRAHYTEDGRTIYILNDHPTLSVTMSNMALGNNAQVDQIYQRRFGCDTFVNTEILKNTWRHIQEIGKKAKENAD